MTSVTGLSVSDLNQLVQDRNKWRSLEYNVVKKRKWNNVSLVRTFDDDGMLSENAPPCRKETRAAKKTLYDLKISRYASEYS